MWKIAVGFAIFAAISLYMIMQFGDQVDMGGEKHGADAIHAPAEKSAAPDKSKKERRALLSRLLCRLKCPKPRRPPALSST